MRTRSRAVSLALCLVGVMSLIGAPARAALFEDDEARRAILELRTKVAALEDARKQLTQQNQELGNSIDPLRRSMLDLNNQIETLRAEVARLRGANEQLAHDLADTQRKLADQSDALNSRLKPLEPQTVSLDGKQFQVDPEEKRQYEAAMGLVRRGDFAEASSTLESFARRFPASGYAASVAFWIGNAQYGDRRYKDAMTSFRNFAAARPDHPRAPDALLALANCQIELKDNKGAKKTLQQLIKSYPGTEAAAAAKERSQGLR